MIDVVSEKLHEAREPENRKYLFLLGAVIALGLLAYYAERLRGLPSGTTTPLGNTTINPSGSTNQPSTGTGSGTAPTTGTGAGTTTTPATGAAATVTLPLDAWPQPTAGALSSQAPGGNQLPFIAHYLDWLKRHPVPPPQPGTFSDAFLARYGWSNALLSAWWLQHPGYVQNSDPVNDPEPALSVSQSGGSFPAAPGAPGSSDTPATPATSTPASAPGPGAEGATTDPNHPLNGAGSAYNPPGSGSLIPPIPFVNPSPSSGSGSMYGGSGFGKRPGGDIAGGGGATTGGNSGGSGSGSGGFTYVPVGNGGAAAGGGIQAPTLPSGSPADHTGQSPYNGGPVVQPLADTGGQALGRSLVPRPAATPAQKTAIQKYFAARTGLLGDNSPPPTPVSPWVAPVAVPNNVIAPPPPPAIPVGPGKGTVPGYSIDNPSTPVGHPGAGVNPGPPPALPPVPAAPGSGPGPTPPPPPDFSQFSLASAPKTGNGTPYQAPGGGIANLNSSGPRIPVFRRG